MNTIVIVSEDDKVWRKYRGFKYDRYSEAEEDIPRIESALTEDGLEDSVYAELVGEDFFEKFGTPYL